MSTINICCLDPRFMLKYCNDDEVIATHQISFNKALSLQDEWKSSNLHVPQQVVKMIGKMNLQMSQLLLLRRED